MASTRGSKSQSWECKYLLYYYYSAKKLSELTKLLLCQTFSTTNLDFKGLDCARGMSLVKAVTWIPPTGSAVGRAVDTHPMPGLFSEFYSFFPQYAWSAPFWTH